MAARPRRTEPCNALRLACWNADGARGRKLELEHFLSQQSFDICLLSETFLNPGQAFRLDNYVCHRTDRPTTGGGTTILVCRCLVQYSVPVPGLTHLEATAIQVTMAGKPVLILVAYISPFRSLIGADLTACFGGGLPVLVAEDLNAKNVDWNSRLNTRQGENRTCLCRRELLSDLWTGLPDHQQIQPLIYSRCSGHRHNQEYLIPSLSDFLLNTNLGPPPGSN